MKNSQDMREDAIKRMVAALKEVRRAEKLLGKPKMHRVSRIKTASPPRHKPPVSGGCASGFPRLRLICGVPG